MWSAAGHYALAVLAAHQESRLLHARHHTDAGRLLCDLVGNCLVRRSHDFVNDAGGGIQAPVQVGFARCSSGGEACACKSKSHNDKTSKKLLHICHFSPRFKAVLSAE
jgi:hypothetical protein